MCYFVFSGHAEDVDADRSGIYDEVIFHHHGNVPTHAVLCLCWGHPVWMCETWREPWQVNKIHV